MMRLPSIRIMMKGIHRFNKPVDAKLYLFFRIRFDTQQKMIHLASAKYLVFHQMVLQYFADIF